MRAVQPRSNSKRRRRSSSRKRHINSLSEEQNASNSNRNVPISSMSTLYYPPRKRPRRLPSALKKKKKNRSEGITIYYQIPDYDPQQIRNILEFTNKGPNRPVLLFADNDVDNVWLRHYFDENGKCQFGERQTLYDEDTNSKLVGTLDNYRSDEFLSVGIMTNYLRNRSVVGHFGHFKENIDDSFNVLVQLIRRRKISQIIIPSVLPVSRSNKKEIFHRLNIGEGLQHRHLAYIQYKINELEEQYAAKYLFTDHPVMFNEDGLFRKMAVISEQIQIPQIPTLPR